MSIDLNMSITVRSARKLTEAERWEMATRDNELRLKPGEQCQGYGVGLLHEPCTGIHSHIGPRSEWCPRTRALDRRWDSTWERTFYKSRHATIGQAENAGFRKQQLDAEWAELTGQQLTDTSAADNTRVERARQRLGSGASAPQRKAMKARLIAEGIHDPRLKA